MHERTHCSLAHRKFDVINPYGGTLDMVEPCSNTSPRPPRGNINSNSVDLSPRPTFFFFFPGVNEYYTHDCPIALQLLTPTLALLLCIPGFKISAH